MAKLFNFFLTFWLLSSFQPLFAEAKQDGCRHALAATGATEEKYREILNHLPAVHATQRFPSDGKILAGRYDDEDPENTRTTLTTHFALGGLVAPHAHGSWNDSPYAVVVPFKEIAPQAANFFVQDTIVFGDYSLPKDAVVIVPWDAEIPADYSFKIFRKPKDMKLRAAVEAVLKEKNYIEVPTFFGTGFPEDPAYLDDINLNGVSFHQFIRKKYPYLTRQNGMAHPLHQADYYLSLWIDYAFSNVFNPARASDIRNGTKIFSRLLDKMEQASKDYAINPEQTKLAEKRIRNARKWLQFLKLEVEAQAEGKSYYKDRNTLIELRNDDVKLREFLAKHPPLPHDRFRKAHASDPMVPATAALPLSEFLAIFSTLELDHWEKKEIEKIKGTYVVHRLVMEDLSAEEESALLNFLESNLKNADPAIRKSVVNDIVNFYLGSDYLSPQAQSLRSPHKIDLVRRILSLPSVKTHLEEED